MSWLDQFFQNYGTIQIAGIPLAQEQILNFASGVTGADDPANKRTNLTITGGGGGGGYYQTVQAAGVAQTQQPALNFIGFTVANDSGNSRTNVTAPSAGGPVVNANVNSATGLTRSQAWTVQPVDTSAGAVTITASGTWQTGDIIQLPDALGAYGTHAVTFNGGSYQVEDPYAGGSVLASTWSSTINGQKPGWILLVGSGGTKVWRSFLSC